MFVYLTMLLHIISIYITCTDEESTTNFGMNSDTEEDTEISKKVKADTTSAQALMKESLDKMYKDLVDIGEKSLDGMIEQANNDTKLLQDTITSDETKAATGRIQIDKLTEESTKLKTEQDKVVEMIRFLQRREIELRESIKDTDAKLAEESEAVKTHDANVQNNKAALANIVRDRANDMKDYCDSYLENNRIRIPPKYTKRFDQKIENFTSSEAWYDLLLL